MADAPYVVGDNRKSRLMADALRATQYMPAMQERAPGSIVVQGFGSSPTRVINNSAGRTWNAVKDLVAGAGAVAAQQDAREAQAMQQQALSDAMQGEMTPEKILRLRQLGVDSETLKMINPQQSKLGLNQIVQYGQTAHGMRLINQVQPNTFSEDAIAKAEAAEKAAREGELSDKIRVAEAGRAPREDKPKSIDELLVYGTPEEQARAARAMGIKRGSLILDETGNIVPAPTTTKTNKRGAKTPEENLSELKTYRDELTSILSDPRADTQLFGFKQRVVVPAGQAPLKGDNPSVAGTMVGQFARGQQSPLAARLERLNVEKALARVKELYPASNTDIALLMRQQAAVGESRQSMTEYLNTVNNIIKKAESGSYGEPKSAALPTEDLWGDVPVNERPPGWERYPADRVEEWKNAQ